MNKNPKICLITFLFNKAFIPPLSDLEKVLCPISNDFYSIEGCFNEFSTQSKCNKLKKYRIVHKQKIKIIDRIIRLFYLNLRMSIRLIKISKNIDVCILFMGQYEFIPLLTAKLLRKKVLWILPSYFPNMVKYDTSESSLSKIYIRLQKISFYLSDYIILHSKNLIKEWNMDKYKDKILFAHEYFINFNRFRNIVKYSDRDNIIGFIGRLSEEKGILNFIYSIPLILKKNPAMNFIIVGEGNLKNEVKKYIEENKLNDKVQLISWTEPHEIPNLLNKLKLLIIPSYTESGPIIALESMACGTPILINKVGHIHTLINSGKNGFLLENNTSDCIAMNVTKILNYNNLVEIADNAFKMVQNEFSYENTVQKWKETISE